MLLSLFLNHRGEVCIIFIWTWAVGIKLSYISFAFGWFSTSSIKDSSPLLASSWSTTTFLSPSLSINNSLCNTFALYVTMDDTWVVIFESTFTWWGNTSFLLKYTTIASWPIFSLSCLTDDKWNWPYFLMIRSHSLSHSISYRTPLDYQKSWLATSHFEYFLDWSVYSLFWIIYEVTHIFPYHTHFLPKFHLYHTTQHLPNYCNYFRYNFDFYLSLDGLN